jgi:hypothetical protein
MRKTLNKYFAAIAFLLGDASLKGGFLVTCKGCRRNIPIRMSEFPFRAFSVDCCLCGQRGRYLPSQVQHGLPDRLVQENDAADKQMRSRTRNSDLIDLFH